jgi:hypothetical protein
MSLINFCYLPKNTFTSIIFPFLKTYHNQIGILEKNIKIGECNFDIQNNMILDYNISEVNKTTNILTKISTKIDKIDYNIYENITVKRRQFLDNSYNYTNYSINIVNSKYKPFIYSVKCIEQPLMVDLMKIYTDDIKEFYDIINSKIKLTPTFINSDSYLKTKCID